MNHILEDRVLNLNQPWSKLILSSLLWYSGCDNFVLGNSNDTAAAQVDSFFTNNREIKKYFDEFCLCLHFCKQSIIIWEQVTNSTCSISNTSIGISNTSINSQF